jgi:membrane protein
VNAISSLATYIVPGNIQALESLADLTVLVGSWSFGIFVIAIILKVLIYAKVPWRILFISSTITSVLIVLGTWVLGFYLSGIGGSSIGGVIGSFFVLLLWIYYEAQIFLLGAQLTYILSANREKIHAAGFKII